MMIRRAVVALMLLGAPAVALAQAPAPEKAAEPVAAALPIDQGTLRMVSADKLKNAVGYVDARVGVLERIAKEYPKHADKARQAVRAYRDAFGPGRDAMVRELEARDPAAAKALADFLAKDIPKMIRDAALTEELVERGTREGLYNPQAQQVVHVPWLLAFTPAYVQSPEKELTEGWVRSQTITTPLLKDKVLVAKVPVSWATLNTRKDGAAEAPYIAATAGVGPVMIMVQMQAEPLLKAGDRAWLEQFLKGAVQGQDPASLVNSGLEEAATGEPAATITQLVKKKTKDHDITMLMKMWFIPRDGVLVMCTEQVYDPNPATSGKRSREELQAVKSRYQPVFDAVIKSLKVEPAAAAPK